MTMNIFRKCLAGMILLVTTQAWAVIEAYEFASAADQKRYQVLVEELRCPKCQNQNLSGSNSPIAADLRRELHRMIDEGQSDEDIKAFMVRRYGNFVLYRPPVDRNTLVLWGLPAGLGLVALLVVILYRRRLERADRHQPLSEAEQQQLAALLEQHPS